MNYNTAFLLFGIKELQGDANATTLLVELDTWADALIAAFRAFPRWAEMYGSPDPDVSKQAIELGHALLEPPALQGVLWWDAFSTNKNRPLHLEQGRVSQRILFGLYPDIGESQ